MELIKKDNGNCPIKLEIRDGIHIIGTILWFDSILLGGHERSQFIILSRAKHEFISRKQRKILCTSRTARLLQLKSLKKPPLIATFNRAFSIGAITLELFPAGLMPGSAQTYIKWNDVRIVYSGELGCRSTLLAEKREVRECDILILCTRNVVLNEAKIKAKLIAKEICQVAETALAKGWTLVFMVDQFGEAQDLIRILGEASFKLRVDKKISKINKIYEEFGVHLKNYSILNEKPKKGEIIILPDNLPSSVIMKTFTKCKILGSNQKLVLSKSDLKLKNCYHLGLMLGSWIDEEMILKYAAMSKAKLIYAFSENANMVVSLLKKKGFKAQVLSESHEQLELW